MNNINNWSNPSVVSRKWNLYKDKEAGSLSVANDGKHKYYILTPDKKKVYFGAIGYEDFTKSKDQVKRRAYLARATKIKGDWKSNKYSANNLAINLLW